MGQKQTIFESFASARCFSAEFQSVSGIYKTPCSTNYAAPGFLFCLYRTPKLKFSVNALSVDVQKSAVSEGQPNLIASVFNMKSKVNADSPGIVRQFATIPTQY